MSVLTGIAIVAAGTAAAAWLFASLADPGRRRATGQWVATMALYAALCAFFLDLARDAWLEQSDGALLAFGLLSGLFGAGLVLSLVKLVAHLSRLNSGGPEASG